MTPLVFSDLTHTTLSSSVESWFSSDLYLYHVTRNKDYIVVVVIIADIFDDVVMIVIIITSVVAIIILSPANSSS